MNGFDIPCEFYTESWEDADHPMACVGTDNRFVRVNHAFERLLGYSSSELEGRMWMEFTRKQDIGGDLASVQDVIDGKIEGYRLEKDYIHKRGHFVSIVLGVRRYPRSAHLPLLMFRVEAPLATATRPEIQDIASYTSKALEKMESQIVKMQENLREGVQVTVGDQITSGGDTSGRDKITNSDKMIKFMVGGFIVMCVAMAWLMYYVATTAGGNSRPEPPAIQRTMEQGQ